MKVAIIGGTGDQGFGLALRFAKAGEKVLLGSRDIKKAENTVNIIHNMLKGEELECIQGMTNQQAAQKGDLVILTVPLQAQKVTLRSIKDHLEGKILVDATVPLETCIGGSSTRYVDLWEGSAAERTAEFLKEKETTIVSAFNNISSSSLTNIKEDVKCDCLVSGDDAESKNKVMELAEKIPGVRAIDCGPLENARIVEKITPLLITLNIKNKTRLAGLRITGL
ncbi:NADPH-dependent F420 reductase [Methanobacterium alkalithermotolerans]|uniref:NADPH-dependent F420 reductase n=1 Tax=Methanobacterium alkalithermotolerans TaxID=2731220 RepID=A0A8T8KA29_9EURY|nr:NADPH-dependent F420 reductase [Methanobacterium alkalithermotolerans]QUH22281.1 NADPH-dependent F420 reductase [Methanobacterium alkalithermotolerans]